MKQLIFNLHKYKINVFKKLNENDISSHFRKYILSTTSTTCYKIQK